MVPDRRRVARMRRVAVRALEGYPLVDRELRCIADEENATFGVAARTPDGRDRFLLRVHRPVRHGRDVDSSAAVGSELGWLTALRAETDLLVPVPFRTTDWKLTTVAASPGVPEPRVCSVLRWMEGRVHAAAPRPVHLYRLGGVMARLHDQAGQWRVPPGFVQIRWDWETFFATRCSTGDRRRGRLGPAPR
jgi:Ser/Thr protein kinase RdoA (MazF antagonist)